MTKNSRLILYSAAGTAGLLIIILSIRFIAHSQYTHRLPEEPESQFLTDPVMEQISKAEIRAKRNPSAENLGMLGMVYHSSANYKQAAQCYELAIERDDSEWIWYYYLGYLYMEMSESDPVLENFNQVIEINPEVHHAWYYCGEEYMNRGEFDQAEKYFGVIKNLQKQGKAGPQATRVDHYPLGTYALFNLANIYYNTERNENAEKTLLEIIKVNRRFGPAYRLLGNLYRMQGNIGTSDRYLAFANDLAAYSPPVDTLIDQLALLSKSELYLLKKIDEAVNAIYSDWALRLIDHGMPYISESKYLLSKAIKICLWLNFNQRASTYVDQHFQLSQDDFNELYFMAKSLFDRELYESSLRYWARALELKPGTNELQEKLAICYWRTGEHQKSLDILDEILAGNPDDLDILADVTDLLFFELGEQDRANSYLRFLEHINPSNPKVQKILAWKAEKKGEVADAIRLYEASFRGDPEDLTTIKNLGRLLTGQKNWAKAVEHYREALTFHPNEPYILERLGTLLILCPDEAFQNLPEGMMFAERAFIHNMSTPPESIGAGRSLALAYYTLGDKTSATTIINTTIEIARHANYAQGHLAELENYLRLIQSMPD